MPDINVNIKSTNTGGMGSTSTDYLTNVLNKLSAAVDKLSASKAGFNSGGNVPNSQDPFSKTNNPMGEVTNGFDNAVEEFNRAGERAFRELGSRIGATLGTAITAAVGITVLRTLNNNANAIMGRASVSGNFIAEAIGGNAHQAFGGYVSGLYDVERQRRIANTNALYEGVGGAVGAPGGAALSLVAPELALGSVGKLAAGGATIGVGAGDYLAASTQNQYTEQEYLARAALAKKAANASISQWRTGFSRFGFQMTNHEIVPGDINGGRGVSVPLADSFNAKYDNPRTQNYNAILNNIVPYMTSNPMDSKNGNLDDIAQTFKQAGFHVEEFGKLTQQSTQYMMITGKNFKSFADDLSDARVKFGDAYDINANQNALTLMSFGMDKDRAQHLANQSIYNPGVQNGISSLMNSSYSDYYTRKAISPILGFDLNKSLAAGQMIGIDGKPASKALKNRYSGYLSELSSGTGHNINLDYLNNAGKTSNEQLSSMLLPPSAEGGIHSKLSTSPGEDQVPQAGTLDNLIGQVDNMTVNAGTVIVNSQANTPSIPDNQIDRNYNRSRGITPPTYAQGNSPTVKY